MSEAPKRVRRKAGVTAPTQATPEEAVLLRAIVTADVHVDSTRGGEWSAEHGVNENWVESFGKLEAMVNLVAEHKADALVVAGDLFDTGRPTAEAVARFNDVTRALPNDSLIILTGNHDRQGVSAGFRTPGEGYLASLPQTKHVSASTEVIQVAGAQLAMLPWQRVAGASKQDLADFALAAEVERLSQEFTGPGILVGHLTVSGNNVTRGSEMSMMTETMEATTSVGILESGPWAHAYLGHIHVRQELSSNVHYVGSPWKVSFQEERSVNGCDLVTVYASGRVTNTFIPLPGRNLYTVDLTEGALGDIMTVAQMVNPRDKVRVLVESGRPENWRDMDKALRMMEERGISYRIDRQPQVAAVVAGRTTNVAVDTSPMDALRIYLEKQVKAGYDTDVEAIMATFVEVLNRV